MFLLKGLESYQPSKYKCSDFLSKTHVTFLLWLITFEPLEQKQSYIPLLKVLMCDMNAWGAQWHGDIFILQYTPLKMVLLLHKTALVNFIMPTTVDRKKLILLSNWNFKGSQILHIQHTAGAASSLSRQEIKRTSFSNEVD